MTQRQKYESQAKFNGKYLMIYLNKANLNGETKHEYMYN